MWQTGQATEEASSSGTQLHNQEAVLKITQRGRGRRFNSNRADQLKTRALSD